MRYELKHEKLQKQRIDDAWKLASIVLPLFSYHWMPHSKVQPEFEEDHPKAIRNEGIKQVLTECPIKSVA